MRRAVEVDGAVLPKLPGMEGDRRFSTERLNGCFALSQRQGPGPGVARAQSVASSSHRRHVQGCRLHR